MSNFLGEFDCKLDDRNRLMIPANLLKQLSGAEDDGVVINRGFEKCLVLYTKKEWDKIVDELSKLNPYEKKTREFIRYFTRGASHLKLDKSTRVVLATTLMDYAGIKKDVVISCQVSRIEIWAQEDYDTEMIIEPEDFSDLAEQVMGNKARRGDDE